MSRDPVYSVDGKRRVISAHNGLWQLQEYDGNGAWRNRGAATDRDTAVKAMGQ